MLRRKIWDMWTVERYRPNSTAIEAECEGPDERGQCRRVTPGHLVACAGRDIRITEYALLPSVREPRYSLSLTVSPDAHACPLTMLGWVTPSYGTQQTAN
ncbi:MAG: hypothetical protein ACE5FA_03250 [Dehalococcoidia bacterium]